MTGEMKPIEKVSNQTIGFKSKPNHYTLITNKRTKENTKREDNNNSVKHWIRLPREIKTFRGVKFDSFNNSAAISSTVDHSLIREKAKKRVFALLLNDELIRIEKDKEKQVLMKQREEEKEIEMIKAKAKEFRNTNNNNKYSQFAKQIMSTRVKLDYSMNTKKLRSKQLDANKSLRDNTKIYLSQRKKIDFRSHLIQTIKDKTNKASNTSLNKEKQIKADLNSNNKAKDINNPKGKSTSNCGLSDKGNLKPTNRSSNDRRVKDLTQFLSHFAINPNEKEQ